MGGEYTTGIGSMSSDAPQSQQSEEFSKDVASADAGKGTKVGSGDYQDKAIPDMNESQSGGAGPAVEGGKYMGSMTAVSHLAAGKLDKMFYGHYLPDHFKKTSIISTKGRVR